MDGAGLRGVLAVTEHARVLPLDQLDLEMLAAVGGKAANLGILRRAGLPVPNGFCVTTAAYREVAAARVDSLFPALAAGDSAVAAEAAEQARQLLLTAPVSAELEQAVLTGYRELGHPPVAVRSSATAEDLELASFAGQQDTILNVVGEAEVLAAVRRCWASLWTDRAVSYRNLHGISHSTVALAVVVQEMVQSTAAGVMFTANPVTGNRNQTVIDASAGLGEAVVSGLVNPDHYVVDRPTSTVERRLGDKRILVRGVPGGGTEVVQQADSALTAALTDSQLHDLVALGDRVQDLYGSPQDTEWATDPAGKLWLTQSRPVTTLYPQPAHPGGARPPAGRRIFMCLTLAQGLTRPITPMGLASFRLIASSVASAVGSPPENLHLGPRAFAEAGQRVFVDFTGVIGNPLGRRLALAVLGVMEARAGAVVRQLVTWPEFARPAGSPLAVARPVLRILGQVRVPQRVVTAILSPARARHQIAELERRVQSNVPPDDATPAARLDHAERRLAQAIWCMPTVIAYALPGFALLALARRLLRGQLEPGELQTVLRGLPHNVTTNMDLELWRLSARIEADRDAQDIFSSSTAGELRDSYQAGTLPRVAQQGLTEFLQRYGHRAVAEIDLGMPRWSDDPSHLVAMIANYLRSTDPMQAADAQFQAGQAEAERMVEQLVLRACRRSRWRGRVVGFSLQRARQLAGLREAPKNLLVLSLAGVRAQLRVVGEVLAADTRIEQPDDVFFLDLDDVRRGLAGGQLGDVVAQRRQSYADELARRHIPRVLLSDGTEPEALAGPGASADEALVGSAASAGQVTGRARVILDPVGARLEPGEILVAPSTDPGWTPLFLTAGGLVMEMGGSNSHGAVVAREYGIPAVVGVPDATSLITTGQRVSVDGAAGLVIPEDELRSEPTVS